MPTDDTPDGRSGRVNVDLPPDEVLTPEQAAAGFAAQLQQPAFVLEDARGRRYQSRLTGAQFLLAIRRGPSHRPSRPGRTRTIRRQAHSRSASERGPPAGEDGEPHEGDDLGARLDYLAACVEDIRNEVAYLIGGRP